MDLITAATLALQLAAQIAPLIEGAIGLHQSGVSTPTDVAAHTAAMDAAVQAYMDRRANNGAPVAIASGTATQEGATA